MIQISLLDRTLTLEDTVTKHKVAVLVPEADLVTNGNNLTMLDIKGILSETLKDRVLATTDVIKITDTMEDSSYTRNIFIKIGYNISI